MPCRTQRWQLDTGGGLAEPAVDARENFLAILQVRHKLHWWWLSTTSIPLPSSPNMPPMQCHLCGVVLFILLDVQDARIYRHFNVVSLHRDFDEVLNDVHRCVGSDLHTYLLRHTRCKMAGNLVSMANKLSRCVANLDEVATAGDQVTCNINIKIPEEEVHAVYIAQTKGSKSASTRHDLNQIVTISKTLHRARQLPMLISPDLCNITHKLFSGDLCAQASSMHPCLSNLRDTGCLGRVLLVRDTGGAHTAVCGTLHF
mmetsp:Transcript_23495/g.62755  ORF Transcript_23495/g.62755 Transcript_23495/m.62755 type:complete len:258 (+) Transcript_23495:86-859(+)